MPWKKEYVVREQHLLKPDERHFQKLSFTDSEKTQFHEEWSYENGIGKFVKRYVFNEAWRFVLRVRPNIIDRMRKKDALLDARIKEISAYVERNDYGKRQAKILYGNYKYKEWNRRGKPQETNYFKGKTLYEIIDAARAEM